MAVKVDPVSASTEGLTAAQIGTQVKQYLDGEKVATLDIDGQEVSVKAEYPEEEYRTVPQVQQMILSKPSGGYVALEDVAEIYYRDSPSSISKSDKAYQVTIKADYAGGNVKEALDSEVVNPNLTGTITRGTNSRDRMMQSEFSGLYSAIAVALFLVFVVLSSQFESPKFAFMVMTTIPFSLVGSFGLLKVTGVTISMTSILGFLILIGTVVNNGILYVDTVNQYRAEMPLETALIEAGATRLRPILMTSLTTILSMIPMALAFGDSGSTTQGLAGKYRRPDCRCAGGTAYSSGLLCTDERQEGEDSLRYLTGKEALDEKMGYNRRGICSHVSYPAAHAGLCGQPGVCLHG